MRLGVAAFVISPTLLRADHGVVTVINTGGFFQIFAEPT